MISIETVENGAKSNQLDFIAFALALLAVRYQNTANEKKNGYWHTFS